MKIMKNWVKKRHNRIFKMVKKPIGNYLKKHYGLTFTPFDTEGKPYLILANHQTALDHFVILLPLKEYAYLIASEDIFSIRLGKLLSWAVAPVPLVKGQKNVSTILTCRRIAAQNKSVALCPEGNRTFSGKTEYIAPSVAKMAKLLKLPIAFMVIRGGYGVRPRWAEENRPAKMHVSVESVLTQEEYSKMTDDQLYEEICKRLYVDESNDDGSVYDCAHRAEYLERVLYYCPHCGMTHFESHEHELKCTKCGMTVIYQTNKQFTTADGTPPPFNNVNEWYEAQRKFVVESQPTATDAALTEDACNVYDVRLMKGKKLLHKNAKLTLYPDKIVFTLKKGQTIKKEFLTDVTSMAVLGKNKLEIFVNDKVWQVIGDKRFNAVKYANFFFKYKNNKEGVYDLGQFLGL